MVNKRFLEKAEKWKNPSLPDEKTKQQTQSSVNVSNTVFPDNISESFIFSYDHPQHGQFFQELIAKNNELFADTMAEIPTGTSGEVKNMYILRRLALVTTIANDSQLRSGKVWPITPLQSELLFKEGKLPKPRDYWEDLGLLLYDTSSSGRNPMEANSLYESLSQQRAEFGLNQSSLDSRLLVVNTGLETDASMPHGVRLIAIPGVTQIYSPGILKQAEKNPSFEYGLDNGVPKADETGNGNRDLEMPSGDEIGLRVLFRHWNSSLNAEYRNLVTSSSNGQINFALQRPSP